MDLSDSSKYPKSMVSNKYDYYNEKTQTSRCKPTREMEDMINNIPGKLVIGIHNHPMSYMVTVSDINRCSERNYKYGLVICHNGTIYKYKVGDGYIIDEMKFGVATQLNKLDKSLINNNQEEAESAIKNLKTFYVELEVLK